MRWLFDSFFKFLFEMLGVVLFFGFFIGIILFAFHLNTPTFPWGLVILSALPLIPLYYSIKIMRNKTLSRKEKLDKLLGVQPKYKDPFGDNY
jgi:hypothetical protein